MSKMRKVAAAYAIFVGIAMIGIWCMLYITDQIPEIGTQPLEIGMHITAEMVTASGLLLGGVAVLKNKRWGVKMYFLSMGMLLYSLITSPGYYAQRSQWEFVGMFAVFMILTVCIVGLLSFKRFEPSTEE